MAVSVDQIKILVKAETAKAVANLKQTQGAANKTALSFKGMLAAGLGTAAITTAIATVKRAATQAVKTYIEFEQAIANVQSVAGGTRKELEELAKEAGRNTVYSASQSADAMYYLASAGLDVKDMAEVLNPTLRLAAAAQIGIADATNIVVGQLKSFGLGMGEAKRITDEMAQTVRKSNTTLGQLGEALKVAAPIANQFGVATADLNAIMGELANRNIKGSEAGMLFRRAMIRLVKPTGEAKKALQDAGVSLDEVQRLLPKPIKLFEMLGKKVTSNSDRVSVLGQRGVQLFNILDKQGVKSLNDLQKAIEDAGGAAKWMAEKQLDTLNGQFKLLNSAYEDVIITLMGESGLAAALKDVVKDLVAGTKAFGDWLRTAEGIETVNITVKTLGLIFSTVFNAAKIGFANISFSIDLLINSFSTLGQVIYYAFTGNLEGVKAAVGTYFEQIKKKSIETGSTILSSVKNIGESASSFWDSLGKDYSDQEKKMTQSSKTEGSKRLDGFRNKEKEKTKILQKEAKKRQKTENEYTEYLYGSLGKQLEEIKKQAGKIFDERMKWLIKEKKLSFETKEDAIKSRKMIAEEIAKIEAELIRQTTDVEKKIRNEYGVTAEEYARMTKVELAAAKKKIDEKEKAEKEAEERRRERLEATSEIIDKIGSNIASSIGGGAGEAVQGITTLISSLVKAASSGDAVAASMAIVGAAISAIFTEIAKGQKFREMQQSLTLQRMEDVELAYHQEVLRLMDHRHQKEMNQLNERLAAEMKFFLESSEIGKQYQNVLAQEEQERIAQMDADERRKYEIKKQYEEEKEKLEKEQEEKRKKLEEQQKTERNEARRNQFESQKEVDISQAKIDYQKAVSEVHKTFPMPWDVGTRNSLISNLNSLYGKIISSIASQKFLPELAQGTGGFRGGAAVVGERGPEIVNLPGGSQVIPTNRINNTTNMGNTFNIQNLSLPGVQNARQFAEELNQYANSMGKTIFASA